jgi:uncharacterized membrane protein YbaN (DUF454 family)
MENVEGTPKQSKLDIIIIILVQEALYFQSIGNLIVDSILFTVILMSDCFFVFFWQNG